MRRRYLLVGAVIAALAAGPSAQAHPAKDHASPGAWTVVASGLDNPRGLAIAKNGDIWVAEAGKGGPGPCQPGEGGGPPSCFGTTGAFTLIHDGVQKRVVTGLPSFGDQGTGDSAI